MNINFLVAGSCWLFSIYTIFANNDKNCTTIYSKNRTIKLSTIVTRNTITEDKNIGFIKDKEKLITSNDIKNIVQKFNINIPSNCFKIVYKNTKKILSNKKTFNTELLTYINKYLKNRKSLNKVIEVKPLDKQVSYNLINPITITSLKQIESNTYELKILQDNIETKLKVALKMVSPTLIAKHNIPGNSTLIRKLFTIKDVEINEDNLTLKDWQTNQAPMITTQPIKKGAIIKKRYVHKNPRITKKIIAIFKCKNFTMSKELQLKKIYKEHIELEDTTTKKHYVALPTGENKAIIKNVGCWR